MQSFETWTSGLSKEYPQGHTNKYTATDVPTDAQDAERAKDSKQVNLLSSQFSKPMVRTFSFFPL